MTFPSSGITLEVRTTILSPGFISLTSTNTSTSSVFFHTFVTLRDITLARSVTDLRRVHSPSVSPMSSRNITDEAVSKSFLSIDTVIAVASSVATSSLPLESDFIPLAMNPALLTIVIPLRSQIGRKIFLRVLNMIMLTIFSWYL